MPYRILTDQEVPEKSGASFFVVELWPHKSLTPEGFVAVIGGTFAMFLFPLTALLGSAVLWGVLPFAMGALALLWMAVRRNLRDRDIHELLSVSASIAHLRRRDPDGTERDWQANTYWVRVTRHDKVGQVEDYLTLDGGPRTVELGAFLTPEERRALDTRIRTALGRARRTD